MELYRHSAICLHSMRRDSFVCKLYGSLTMFSEIKLYGSLTTFSEIKLYGSLTTFSEIKEDGNEGL